MIHLIYEKPRFGMSYRAINQTSSTHSNLNSGLIKMQLSNSFKTQAITPKGFTILNPLTLILAHLLCPLYSRRQTLTKTIVKSSFTTLTSLSSIRRP